MHQSLVGPVRRLFRFSMLLAHQDERSSAAGRSLRRESLVVVDDVYADVKDVRSATRLSTATNGRMHLIWVATDYLANWLV